MTRIFSALAVCAVAFVIGVAGLGLSLDLHNHLSDEAVQHRASLHRLSGLAAGMVILFVHSIAVTYFVGTTRWCKEVTETYGLSREHVVRSTFYKRRTFPWAILGMLAAVVVVALGGAADPATLRANTADWVMPHQLAAFCLIALQALAFVMEWQYIAGNHAVIQSIVADVERIRRERGL